MGDSDPCSLCTTVKVQYGIQCDLAVPLATILIGVSTKECFCLLLFVVPIQRQGIQVPQLYRYSVRHNREVNKACWEVDCFVCRQVSSSHRPIPIVGFFFPFNPNIVSHVVSRGPKTTIKSLGLQQRVKQILVLPKWERKKKE